LTPQICRSFAVVESSYQVRQPDTFATGSLYRGQAEVNNARNPHIDVTLQQDAGDGYNFADHNPIEMIAGRLAGDQPRFVNCESCWIIDWCDQLYAKFFLKRTLAATEIPQEVIFAFWGVQLCCSVSDVDTTEAIAKLIEAGYPTVPLATTSGG